MEKRIWMMEGAPKAKKAGTIPSKNDSSSSQLEKGAFSSGQRGERPRTRVGEGKGERGRLLVQEKTRVTPSACGGARLKGPSGHHS